VKANNSLQLSPYTFLSSHKNLRCCGFIDKVSTEDGPGIPSGIGEKEYDSRAIFYVGVQDVDAALQKAESLGQVHEDLITVFQYGLGCFFGREPQKSDRDAGKDGLLDVGVMPISGAYDVVILDKACVVLSYKLFTVEQLLDVLTNRYPSCEAIVTGRCAPPKLINAADLVTEMKESKHYYTRRHGARWNRTIMGQTTGAVVLCGARTDGGRVAAYQCAT
jgi:cob(I)alamin adenosyltransferase